MHNKQKRPAYRYRVYARNPTALARTPYFNKDHRQEHTYSLASGPTASTVRQTTQNQLELCWMVKRRQRRTFSIHVSLACLNHNATVAIMQDANVLEHKSFTKDKINLVQHVHHGTLHMLVK
jgi:hypothetical protein